MQLPPVEVIERFAPLVDSSEERFQRERDRKRVWLRKLRQKPPWPTKEEAAAVAERAAPPLAG